MVRWLTSAIQRNRVVPEKFVVSWKENFLYLLVIGAFCIYLYWVINIELRLAWLIFLLGRFSASFVFTFFISWCLTGYSYLFPSWHIHEAYTTSTWKLNAEGKAPYSIEYNLHKKPVAYAKSLHIFSNQGVKELRNTWLAVPAIPHDPTWPDVVRDPAWPIGYDPFSEDQRDRRMLEEARRLKLKIWRDMPYDLKEERKFQQAHPEWYWPSPDGEKREGLPHPTDAENDRFRRMSDNADRMERDLWEAMPWDLDEEQAEYAAHPKWFWPYPESYSDWEEQVYPDWFLPYPQLSEFDFDLHSLVNQLSDPAYSGSFKFEILLFITLLFLLIKSLSWREQYSYRSLNFWLNIFVILLLLVIFVGTFFSKELFIGSKLLFNCGILVNYSISYAKLFIIAVAIFFLLVSLKFFFSAKNQHNDFVDYPLLIGLSVFFLLILVSSFDLMIMYVSIEGLSILLYILAIFPFRQSSIEASIKYYSLGALSSGILLFGISLMYGVTGAFDFFNIKTYFLFNFSGDQLIFYLMLLSFMFSFLFKLSAFPGHMWAPDVYEGTWLPTTIFFMTVVKVSLYFFFVRFLIFFFYFISALYQDILIISALGSLIVGCFGSLYQHGIKRIFAYGSISQVGFSLMGLACNSLSGIIGSLIFFTIYIIVSLGVFTVLINTEAFYSGRGLSFLSDLSNFSKYNIMVSTFLSFFLLSMAGIPPLAGFFGKLFIFISTIGANYYVLTLLVIFLSTINVFVYTRMIKTLWSDIVLLVIEENNSEGPTLLLYDIFVMNLPKTWRASKARSTILCFYENMLVIILMSITSFVLFFFLILDDYFIFCNELAISLVDALFKNNL